LPLDGSELSEVAIPLATTVARAQGAEVTLVRVVPPLTAALAQTEGEGYMPPETYDEIMQSMQDEAATYLAGTAKRLEGDGIAVKAVWREGSPGSTLLDVEEELRPDLVVMATHGRTGLIRFALGGIADRMVREGTAPVLLARSFTPTETQLETALVPLDGSNVAEAALPLVEHLAGRPLRSVQLLRAVAKRDEEAGALTYLQGIASRLSSLDVQVTNTVVHDQPTDAIAEAAQRVDFVIISTHGRSGFDRLRHGSIAEKATRTLATPTLLVRAGAATQASSSPVR
jgi:nucleotide-binding universal stress UspA family protein